jgi:hypothetical protein
LARSLKKRGILPRASSRNPFIKHVALPALAPAAVVGLYFTPVVLFGCVNRGRMAIAIVLVSTAAASVTTAIGARARAQHHPSSGGGLLSTIILLLPIALIIGRLG